MHLISASDNGSIKVNSAAGAELFGIILPRGGISHNLCQ